MSSITSDALFVSDDGNPLSRQFFIKHVKIISDNLGLQSKNYNGHSFRIGATTTAQEVRLEDHLIKTLGRWSSDCYTRLENLVVSYDSVLEISTPMVNDACRRHRQIVNLSPTLLRFSEPDIPLLEGEPSINISSFPVALKGEVKWLNVVVENSSVKAEVWTNISWYAYHASSWPDVNKSCKLAMSALRPLFHEQAESVAMIRHSLNVFVAL
ncbi:unnamed protein product [Mytilus coruscus]|uniref:Tyr recombinase domain-containing protein n=1 Tax=Mytilus coruscus TaxID=42192 RepID=A0A6J8CG44_MYTCO|nr:unnamed protein product [Mytilus coruscus]